MLDDKSDEALMAMAASGHRLAFEALVKRHLGYACAIAGRVSGRPADAEDIAQEAFIRVWVNAPTWQDGRAKFSTWFYRIVANAAIDRYRRHRREVTADGWERLSDPAPGAEADLAARQKSEAVMRAINMLPEKQRLAVLLCYHDAMTNREAAAIMGINIKSLEGLLNRARKGLKDALTGLEDRNEHEA